MSEGARSRRRAEQGPGAESWFGAGAAESDWDELDVGREPSEAPLFFQSNRRLAFVGGNAFTRLYRAFLAARAALGLALIATQLIAALLGARAPLWTLLLCLVYAAEALALWLLPRLQRGASARTLARVSSPQWWASIGVDLTVFGLLHALDRSLGVNFGALFVLPVLMAGVLTSRLLALATAAMAALVMLGVAGWSVWLGGDAGLRMTQAGLVGIGLFVISLLASEMANRLAREEQTARGSMEFARQQAQLNRLVIEEMQEGVLVVDRRGLVRAANPAARALLGAQEAPVRTAPFQLRGVPDWEPLVQAVEQAFTMGDWPAEGRDVGLHFAAGIPLSLRVRMRFTRRRASHAIEDLCVLFIEDNRTVLARSRQEKLAAMGRVSAGIAHEIRNPLAAIDQANALLAEDCADPHAQQLTRMVASNVQRLKRIVDDVMEVAPGALPEPVPVDASALLAETCADWARTNQVGLAPQGALAVHLPDQALVVSFEPEHLRRVLVNLLDNALRHAQPGPGAVQVQLGVDAELPGTRERWASLSVFSVGEAISPEVERHLFEPFFSTRSRGSGLGLYICRELCERYGARIEYRAALRAGRAGNDFVLRLRLVGAAAAGGAPLAALETPASHP